MNELTQKQKMLEGIEYFSSDKTLFAEREHTYKIRDLINQLEECFAYDQVFFPSINTRIGPSNAYIDRQTARSTRNIPIEVAQLTWPPNKRCFRQPSSSFYL